MTNCDHTYNSFLFTPYLYYPDFDFTVPEVTFMSADTDKYDYSLKGTSEVHYHTPGLRHAQYFSYSHWTGGLYTTATLADSFPGGLIAQCWASMMLIFYRGYEENASLILESAKKIALRVNAISGLQVTLSNFIQIFNIY